MDSLEYVFLCVHIFFATPFLRDIVVLFAPYALPLGVLFFFFQAEDVIRARDVTGVQTCALPI